MVFGTTRRSGRPIRTRIVSPTGAVPGGVAWDGAGCAVPADGGERRARRRTPRPTGPPARPARRHIRSPTTPAAPDPFPHPGRDVRRTVHGGADATDGTSRGARPGWSAPEDES